MLRIYLDQNKWIDLARAATGKPATAGVHDALEMCRAAVQSGAASFPLDMYRYWETSKRGNDRSRDDVVDLMWELSQQHTMATPVALLDREIDLALHRRYGRPELPRSRQVFGVGIQHIVQGRLELPDIYLSAMFSDGDIPAGVRAQLDQLVGEIVEEQLLRIGPRTLSRLGYGHSSSDHAERFVAFENTVAAAISQQRLAGYAIDVAVRATDLGDIRPALVDALDRIDMSYRQFLEHITVGEVMSFMDDLPTRYVTNVMRSAKHRGKEQKWEPNDFADILALPVAAVYCDVIVTEKQWVHHLRNRKVDQRYTTRLLSNVSDLVSVLVNAPSPTS
ncbi:hypothetical protein ACQPXM_25075 [Kribbella sp. CA-253562]|uniref:hypothetical protein n=1 Tax=Kribbella sp. CA-253562 TaxID=3239942 RepID=UPI003D8FB4E1